MVLQIQHADPLVVEADLLPGHVGVDELLLDDPVQLTGALAGVLGELGQDPLPALQEVGHLGRLLDRGVVGVGEVEVLPLELDGRELLPPLQADLRRVQVVSWEISLMARTGSSSARSFRRAPSSTMARTRAVVPTLR